MPLNVLLLVPAVAPTVMVVVEPLRPLVPMFTVFVLPEVVAPDARPIVLLTVADPNVFVPFEKTLVLLNVWLTASPAKTVSRFGSM